MSSPDPPAATERPGITAILYTHADADALVAAVQGLHQALSARSIHHDILVVEDGATDSTAEAALAAAAGLEGAPVRVLRTTASHGYGAALRVALAEAREPWVLVLDARDVLDEAALDAALEAAGAEAPCDLVVGCRDRHPGGVRRRIAYRLFRLFCRVVFGLPVRDVNSRFNLFRRQMIERIVIQSAGCFADAEILAKAGFFGFMMGEVRVRSRIERAAARQLSEGCLRRTLREAWTVFHRPVLLPPSPPANGASENGV